MSEDEGITGSSGLLDVELADQRTQLGQSRLAAIND
jgi:hypothetical protein